MMMVKKVKQNSIGLLVFSFSSTSTYNIGLVYTAITYCIRPVIVDCNNNGG